VTPWQPPQEGSLDGFVPGENARIMHIRIPCAGRRRAESPKDLRAFRCEIADVVEVLDLEGKHVDGKALLWGQYYEAGRILRARYPDRGRTPSTGWIPFWYSFDEAKENV